ncbi:MAG: DNA alkylation repair protein [Bermanella sp.]
MTEPSPSLLRDSIGPRSICGLSERIDAVFSGFERKSFEKNALENIHLLGLSERIQQVRESLKKFLPEDFSQASSILISALGSEVPQDNLDGIDLSSSHGFIILPQCEFISHYGLQHFDLAMNALMEMTKRFSSEGAIRAFIDNHHEKTYEQLKKWSAHDNVHVRRLVSEGTRPRLPLFSRLPRYIKDPAPVIFLLEKLKNDPQLYVRRSVANNLNDISKDNPKAVTDLLLKWSIGASSERLWLIKHALRTLVKQGNQTALSILGFKPVPDLLVSYFTLDKCEIKLGEALKISTGLVCESEKPHPVMIDYVIHHKKANGKLSPKVFKWGQKSISKKTPIDLGKKHSIKKISTRKYYAGEHEVHLQINGEVMAVCHFTLSL